MTDDQHWNKNIAKVESQLNNAHNKTVGDTPFHILFGYYPNFDDGVLQNAVVDGELKDTNKLQMTVREKILEEHRRWQKRYNTIYTKCIKYKVGEVVFIRRPPEHTGESTKLQQKFREPLIVMEALLNDAYRVTARA